ncbi:PQQ-binding-like beta-propeller repeat protein [Nannocystis pusilla]|uniref:outer membrane protein assembly factor BamB family protein n=1 Tax=Nannocystis pusilla TaxID=889268 RepID=UPI003BEF5916
MDTRTGDDGGPLAAPAVVVHPSSMAWFTRQNMTIWGATACLLACCGPGAPGESGSDSSEGTGGSPGSGTLDPDPTTSPPPATTATSGETGETDDTGATGFDTADTEIPPEPGVPLEQFTCAGARWRFVDPTPSLPGAAAVDSRGHLRVTSSWSILDLDETGQLVGQLDASPPWGWGGLDAGDNVYLSFHDEASGRKGLRKFAATGAPLWEIDRGPASDRHEFAGRVTVAPDGTTLVGDRQHDRVERYDAAGATVWDKTLADKSFDDLFAMNTAGVAVALRYGAEGAIIALAPDASVLWEHPFATEPQGYADIGESGEVVAVSNSWPPHVIRLAADGSVQWDKVIELPQLAHGAVSGLATNQAGEIALAVPALLGDTNVAAAVRLDASGEVVAVHACDPTSLGSTIALDEAGTIYFSGIIWADDGEHLFAVALE